MLVYLFLWFYLSIICMVCNGFQSLTDIEAKSTTRKYRNPDRSFKQHIVSHSPKMLPDALEDNEFSKANINDLMSMIRDNWEPPAAYLEKRGYLAKKRSEKSHQQQHKLSGNQDYLKDIKSLKEQMRKYYEHKHTFDKELSDTASIDQGRSNEKGLSKNHGTRLANEGKFYLFPHASLKSKEDSKANQSKGNSLPDSGLIVATCGDSTKKPGLMARIKDKFRSMFKSSKNTSLRDDFEMYNDILNEEDADNLNLRKSKQKLLNFKFDDWLMQDDSDLSNIQKRSLECSKTALDGENNTAEESASCKDSDLDSSSDMDLKFGDVMKNLTQADIDYVKSFLKCYKENKQKFYVDYLHMNKSMVNDASKKHPSAKDSDEDDEKVSSKTVKCEKGLNNSQTNDSKSEPMTKKVAPKTIEAKSSTTPAPAKDDDTIMLDIDIKTNATGEGAQNNSCTPLKRKIPAKEPKSPAKLKYPKKIKCDQLEKVHHVCTTIPPQPAEANTEEYSLNSSDTSTFSIDSSSSTEAFGFSVFSNVLKFLAHQHHPVYDVGKLPHKPLDLKHVQEMIDDARKTLAVGVLDNEDDNNTKCTPIRLNEVNLDAEDSGQQNQQSASGWENAGDGHTPGILGGSGDSKEFNGQPHANNYLIPIDQVHKDEANIDHKYDFLFPSGMHQKKRETALPEESSLEDRGDSPSLDSDYSDLIPPIDNFLSGSKQSIILDQYIDDYHMDRPRARKNSRINEDDDNNEADSIEESELFGRRKKKRRKKKKKKYNKKESKSREDPVEFVVETDIFPTAERDKIEEKAKDIEAEKLNEDVTQNDYLKFSELNDVKFQVSPDQEEDIKKFIDGINEPPEVFSFDVEKYLRPKDVPEPVNYESVAPKTFYEFADPPRIENEQVPLIAPEPGEAQAQPQPDVGLETSPKNNQNAPGKRDILRQFIKGLSDRIHDDTVKTTASEKRDNKDEDRKEVLPIDRDKALMSNYANDLDVTNYGRFIPDQKEAKGDDFIDNYFLLNDGTFSVYNSEKPVDKIVEKYSLDPINLSIDLDLDHKFKDLHVPQASIHPVGRCGGMDCNNDKELDMEPVVHNNFGLRYIPDSVFHKQQDADKPLETSLEKKRK